MAEKDKITIQQTIDVPVARAWEIWTNPTHIKEWNQASEDWHTPEAENDVRVGGQFRSRMEAKDGSEGFDFGGTYDAVVLNKHLAYTMSDGRTVEVTFQEKDNKTVIVETFDPEDINPIDKQKQGWQSILDRFKKYAEHLKE